MAVTGKCYPMGSASLSHCNKPFRPCFDGATVLLAHSERGARLFLAPESPIGIVLSIQFVNLDENSRQPYLIFHIYRYPTVIRLRREPPRCHHRVNSDPRLTLTRSNTVPASSGGVNTVPVIVS